MVNKSTIVKNSLKYGASNIFLRVVQIIQGLIVANLLGPYLFGLKNGLQLYFDWGSKSNLGTLNTVTKKRQLYEYSNKSKAEWYSNLAFTFNLFMSILLFIISIIIVLFINVNRNIKIIILLIGGSIFFINHQALNSVILQSKQKFKELSLINFIHGILIFVLVLILVYFLDILGYFLGIFLSSVIIAYITYKYVEFKPKFIFDLKTIYLMFKKGLILFVIDLSFLLIFSIDRIVIWFGYNTIELGNYAIGLFFANLVYFVICSLILPLIPNIYQNITNNEKLIKYIIRPTNLVFKSIFYIVILLIFFSPFIVFILPQYSNSLSYVNILIFSVMFFPILIVNYFIGSNKERFLLFLTLGFIFLAIILNLLILYFKFTPIFIAYATLGVLFAYGNITNLIGYKYILGSWKLALKEIFNYLWPLSYALIGYGLLWILAHYWLYDIMNYYIVKIIQAVLFTIWYSPILWKIEKEHRILRIIWQGVKNKLSKQPMEQKVLE